MFCHENGDPYTSDQLNWRFSIRISGGAMLAGIGNRIMLPLGSASTPGDGNGAWTVSTDSAWQFCHGQPITGRR